MAKLALGGLIAGLPLDSYRDERTTASFDAQSNATTIIVANVQNQAAATIVVAYAAGNLDSLIANVNDAADKTVIARFNRLVGTIPGAPRLEKYHRTGKVSFRSGGKPIAVPAGLYGARTVTGWTWSVVVNRPSGTFTAPVVAPVAPVAPVSTPTPAPVAPVVAPAPEPDPAPEPEPEPVVVAPVAPIRITPDPITEAPAGSLFTYPKRSTTNAVVIDADDAATLEAAWQKHLSGNRATIALVGPSGTGKTSLIWDFAAEKGVGVFVVDCAGIASMTDVVGATALIPDGNGGTITTFIPSGLLDAIRIDGPDGDRHRIVLLDEFNRGETSASLNAFMPIMSAASIYVAEWGRTVQISRNVLFAATMNRGSAYGGTVTLDAALADRLQIWCLLDYLPIPEEVALVSGRTGLDPERTEKLVRTAAQIREIAARGEIEHGISTRRVLDAADFVVNGLSLRTAATRCWANAFAAEGGSESERGVVLTAINASLV